MGTRGLAAVITAILTLLSLPSVAQTRDPYFGETGKQPSKLDSSTTSLNVTVGKRVVSATGLSAGATSILFIVAHDPIAGAYMNRVRRWLTSAEADRTGSVSFQFQEDIPPVSLCVVADSRTGEVGISTGERLGVRRDMTVRNPLRRGALAIDRFAFNHPFLDLLYVHPLSGVWAWSAMDGVTTDLDGANGMTTVALSQASGIIGTKRPTEFVPGGTLVAIDFASLEVAVVRVDDALIGGVR